MRISFDVDGTLIRKTRNGDAPRYDIIQMLLFYESLGHTVFVWSGGGEDYARMWVDKLGLPDSVRVIGKKADTYDIDLCFDDEDVQLATLNCRV